MPTEKSMEKAREIAGIYHYDWEPAFQDIRDKIATALDSAIAETREECAKAAGDFLMLKTGIAVELICDCQDAIRATGKESKP